MDLSSHKFGYGEDGLEKGPPSRVKRVDDDAALPSQACLSARVIMICVEKCLLI